MTMTYEIDHEAQLIRICGEGRNVAFGMGRMFELASDQVSPEFGIFRTIEEAVTWLSPS